MIDQTDAKDLQISLAGTIDQQGLLSDLRSFLGKDLAQVEQRIQDAVESRFEFANVAKQASAMGGKRLRPMLVLLSAYAVKDELSPRDLDDLISISASVELVHAASLVHDDVLDQAMMRRHRPTVLSQSDNRTAILLGDFLFTRAYALAARCRSAVPARQIASAAAALCSGELRQGMAAGNWEISVADYRQMLVQKTGSLCGASCRLGSWRAGGRTETQKALKRFGVLLGLAFQIFDDWLDYWGSAAVGKTLGTDLEQGKATLPILHYLASKAPPAGPDDLAQGTQCSGEREEMLALLRSKERERFRRVVEKLDECGSSNHTRQAAAQLASRAMNTIDVLPSSTAKELLSGLALFSASRKA